jgi:hypothetical protein
MRRRRRLSRSPISEFIFFRISRAARVALEDQQKPARFPLYGWNSRNLLAAHEALKDKGKRLWFTVMAGNRPRANPGRVTLPRPLSLSDFEPKFFIRRASAARPIRPAPAADFFLATFLFSDSAAPATHGRRAIAPRARRSMATAPGSNEAPLLTLAPTLALKFRNFFIPSRGAAAPALDFSF